MSPLHVPILYGNCAADGDTDDGGCIPWLTGDSKLRRGFVLGDTENVPSTKHRGKSTPRSIVPL